MAVDITASLHPIAVDVQLGDWIYQIPPLPAAVWIEAIADIDGGAIVPGLFDDLDQTLVWREFVWGRIRPDELKEAWRLVVGVVCGRPWWEAARLVLSATAQDNWPVIHGKLVQRGMDLMKCSIGGFCNVVHVMALEGCQNEQERSQYQFDLSLPPPEVSAEEAHLATDAAADFMGAMQQFQQLS